VSNCERGDRDPKRYRRNVGIAIFNPQGQIWLGKRFGEDGPHCWQCPQGGMDAGERPKQAAKRELFEETGLRAKQMTYLGRIKPWLYYDFPPKLVKKNKRGHLGQRQKWFAWRYEGDGSHIDLKAHGPQEFSEWRWAELSTITDTIVPFKRDVYARLVDAFADYAKPDK
jgi:putative (di)nucleoside polyphosphate hydrolase